MIFISLSMIIPRPTSPNEETIDVYLQPLVNELMKLWKGVSAVNMSEPARQNRSFKMSGMLIWTIHDFLAYTVISGRLGKAMPVVLFAGRALLMIIPGRHTRQCSLETGGS
jgi:hypothetical protein